MLWFRTLRYRLENTELFVQLLWHLHYCRYIVASVTVIWGWPYRHQVLRCKPKLEPFLNQLMRSRDQLNSVDVIKVSDHFCPENPSRSSVVWCPCLNIFRIRPHKIAKCSWNNAISYLREEFPFFCQWFSFGQWSWFQVKVLHGCKESCFQRELQAEGNQMFNWSTSMGSSIRIFSWFNHKIHRQW